VGTSAAIGAGFLLLYGFFVLQEPTGTDLFEQSAWVFYQTLRVGGILLLLSALCCWTGRIVALIAEGLITIAIGISLLTTAAGMFLGGGGSLQPALNALFGCMFLSAGLHSIRLYRATRDLSVYPGQRPVKEDAGQDSPAVFIPTEPIRNIKGRREAESRSFTAPAEPAAIHPSTEPVQPPQGYLAAFARKPPPENNP
jgi:hypothetical protein